MTSLAFSSTAMDTAPSSSGMQDFHDAVEGTVTSPSDDAILVESLHQLSDPATEITERVCEQCMDTLLISIKNDDDEEVKHWCLECHDGRFAKHEEDEKNAAEDAVIIDSSDDDAVPGGDPGNSEYIDGTSQRQTKASHDKKSQDSGARDENMFCGIFGQPEDSIGNKRRLPTTGEEAERNDTDEETSAVSTDRLSINHITASADPR